MGVLSQRENEVVHLLLQGMSNKQMALSLGISERTVEFHLENIYAKLHVSSRVELILKLGKATGSIFGDPVQSTVEVKPEKLHNGNQNAHPGNWKHLLTGMMSVIQKEVAMVLRVMLEDLGNYLRKSPWLFNSILLMSVGLTTRYILLDLGLYFWPSYILLGILLGIGSIYIGLSWKKIATGTVRSHPLVIVGIAVISLLFVAGLDEVFLYTIVRQTGSTSITIADISNKAMWLISPLGQPYLSTERSVASDLLWLLAILYMVLLFVTGVLTGTRSRGNDLAAAS